MPAIILYDATRKVKRNRPFARGVFASRPFRPSDADASWWAAHSPEAIAAEEARINREVDQLFRESEALDRMSRGLDA